MKLSHTVSAVALALAPIVAAGLPAPALAAVDNSDPQRFIETLTTDGFAAMKTGSKGSARSQFRTLLSQNVAVDQIGDRLIGRWASTITPEQKAAYKSVLPNYIVGTYADRLFEYADATIKVTRATPSPAGGVDVASTVQKPGAQPIPCVWSVVKTAGGWKVANLRVGGINVALAQAADFNAVIQRQGFDALVAKMKARG